MNNLLRSLAGSQIKSALPESDLKLLLQAVKEGRRQTYDAKVSDPFYDALEDLLHDLRTVTMDNHDPEAFLKPVSRTDVPDYYDVISNPMDFQTMSRKVKQKQYKSKKEFKDDLDLIWSNCFTYNATENHPLRLCASRLKVKAEKLLKNITDRKERADPSIPADLSIRRATQHKANGINGHVRTTSTVAIRPPIGPMQRATPSNIPPPPPPRRDLPFAESPAIIRTAEGMRTFYELDRAMSESLSSVDGHTNGLEDRLREYINVAVECEDIMMPSTIDGVVGDKRKLNGTSEQRPVKRVRLHKKKQKTVPPNPHSLLTTMNTNIKTLRRVRQTHSKFAALNVPAGGTEEASLAPAEARMTVPTEEPMEMDELDERPWTHAGAMAKEGIDLGEEAGNQCLHWMNRKVLEHVGFQGSSSIALDVLSSIASEYLMNVGRTFRFYIDKYSNSMTTEEIILHTLFESGTSRIQDMERYINDDVIRHGNRLNDLEKKLVNAYQEFTSTDALDDDAIFGNEEDEEEESAFVMGQFTDDIGEDFLGLRALGIAEEFGLSNLTIPKRLLKGKKNVRSAASAAKPAEPPPPYPPPPPFIPLDSIRVEDQIGLLKPYYQHRMSMLAATHPPSLAQSPLVVTLSDDPPNPAQSRIGPLGQVLKANPTAGPAKKKSKAKDGGAGATGMGGKVVDMATPSMASVMSPLAESEGPLSPKKKKGPNTGAGATTNGTGKKRGRPPEGICPSSSPLGALHKRDDIMGAAVIAIFNGFRATRHKLVQPISAQAVQLHPIPYGGQPGYGGQQGYGAPPGYGAPGGFAPPGQLAGPPQGADPQLWSWFTAVDVDRSNHISSAELQKALINGDWTPFDLDTVKLLMTIFDTDRSGTIGFNEDWQNVFRHFDRDRSGSIDGRELQEALRQFGYNLSPQLLQLVERKYDVKATGTPSHHGASPGISFDRFVRACVVIKQISESFSRLDTDRDGWIQINYDQFMQTVLTLP
ncbi:hypothetical protein EW146_g882 [Bondarzewia mesenterica]|uniref:Bromo domain-containing protein n=1 Tax=Bondarzewia mesenterica TaxID=1095465 RepID=A0A4S4MBT9_9AGAM|nr:hypothetical protein EW146_g882 [Bondarzewia mesenterica]